ncbi:MAG: oxidoreductase [bacterium]|nr:SDR family NAD(P)-dependent oxidoreductase [Acidimicrobiia bacterium]MCY4650814.1 oxidoreductase [bacterium]
MSAKPEWGTEQIPDLSGKVMVVTGANSGIGLEAARELARQGAHTILACRSAERGQSAVEAIRAGIPHAQVELMMLDLASLASVQGFAEAFTRSHSRLDVLANNAGIMAVPYSHTEDGFESQMGINHLGHFALTGRLLEVLLGTPGARVVNVSSTAHRPGRMDFGNLLFENGGYSPFRAYCRSKLANLLFTFELQRRFEDAGAPALAVACHPGMATTNIGSHLHGHRTFRLSGLLTAGIVQSASMGALPTLRAAVDPQARGGQYFGPKGFAGQRGHPGVASSTAASRNATAAERLWKASVRLTGVRYSLLS